MPKREPGFYEPSSSDDDRVFDGGEDEMDAEGSRLPLLLVIALIMVFAFGGVVWLAYKQGEATGRSGAPQIIAAEKGPVRTAPANPGGQTPYQGLKVYDQPAPLSDDSTTAKAETPPALRQAEAPASPLKQIPIEQAPAPQRTAAAAPEKPAASAPAPQQHIAAVTPAQGEAHAPPAQLSAPKPAQHPPVSKPTEPSQPVSQTRPAIASAAGAWTLQVGAYKSEDEAKKAWQIYLHRYPVAAQYTPDIVRADLGDKGVWYRLHIGSYASRGEATDACTKLKASGAPCFPARG